MKLKEFGVQLGSLVQEFGLEVVYAPENFEKIEVTKDDVNRPKGRIFPFAFWI